jgi:hypothetical protein
MGGHGSVTHLNMRSSLFLEAPLGQRNRLTDIGFLGPVNQDCDGGNTLEELMWCGRRSADRTDP